MENEFQTNPVPVPPELHSAPIASPEPISPFPTYRSYAKGLIWAGVVGLILTGVYAYFTKSLISDGIGNMKNIDLPTRLAYYAFNSCMLIAAGKMLGKQKKIGVFFLVVAIISVFSSIFIGTAGGSNLFLSTIASSLALFMFGAPLGVVFFFGAMIVNILRLRRWLTIVH